MRGRRPGSGTPGARVWVLAVVVLSLMGTLVGRLGQVQIGEQAAYRRAAASVNTRTTVQPALRGRILDRNGIPLVDNTSETVVTVDRTVLADAAGRRSRAAQARGGGAGGAVRPALGAHLPVRHGRRPARPRVLGWVRVRPPAAGRRRRPAPGAEPARASRALPGHRGGGGAGARVPTAGDGERGPGPGLPGPLDAAGHRRLARHRDRPGPRGPDRPGEAVRRAAARHAGAHDGRGRPARRGDRVSCRRCAPVPGRDLVTNLDVRVQAAAEAALRRAVAAARQRGHRADGAAAVVLDTTTGGVLAAASYPTYDPDVWTGGISAQALAGADRRQGRPAADRPRDLRRLPARLDVQGGQPAGRGHGRELAGRHLRLHQQLPDRQPHVRQLRVARLRADLADQGHRGLVRHDLLRLRLPVVAGAGRSRRRPPTRTTPSWRWPTRSGSGRPPGSTCRASGPGASPAVRGSGRPGRRPGPTPAAGPATGYPEVARTDPRARGIPQGVGRGELPERLPVPGG